MKHQKYEIDRTYDRAQVRPFIFSIFSIPLSSLSLSPFPRYLPRRVDRPPPTAQPDPTMMNAMESPKYHDLRADPEAKHPMEDAESSTDYEDDEDDKAWSDDAMQDGSMARRRKTRAKRIRSAVVSFRSILDTGLLLVILGLIIDRRRQSDDGRSLFEGAGDVTGFAPRCKLKELEMSPGDPADDVDGSFPTNHKVFARSVFRTAQHVGNVHGQCPGKMAEYRAEYETPHPSPTSLTPNHEHRGPRLYSHQ